MPTVLSACPPDLLAASRRAPLAVRWCPDCMLGFIATPLADAELDFIYRTYLYISPRNGIGTSKYTGMLDLLRSHSGRREAVVEIGCNEGYLLETLAAEGWTDLLGIEPGPQADEAEAHGCRVRRGFFTAGMLADGSVDVFVLMHVFEHVPDPSAMLQAMRSALRPGGRIIIEVPDFCGFHHQHLQFYSVPFFRRLAMANHLAVRSLHGDGNVVRAVLTHGDGSGNPDPAEDAAMAGRVAGIAGRWRAASETGRAAIADGGRVLWWGAGSASVIALNQLDDALLADGRLTVVDGDPRKAGCGIPGTGLRVADAAAQAGSAWDTLVTASSFSAEIMTRAAGLGIRWNRQVTVCP
jgi:SAM-dependent methyltransferase